MKSDDINAENRPLVVGIAAPIPTHGKGGIATWTRALLERFAIDDAVLCHHINYAAVGRGGTDLCFWKRLVSGVIATRSALRDFRKVKHSCDVLHICSSASYGLMRDVRLLTVARKKKMPSIIHWHFSRIPELYKKQNWEWKLLFKVCKLADEVIVLDQLSFETLQKTSVSNKVKKIPNFIAQDTMRHRVDDIDVIPNSILFVGNVMPYKAVDILVEACANMQNGSTLRIVGDYGEAYHQKLMRIASKRSGDWITFTGGLPHDQVLREMHQCSLFTLPSRHTEAFPIVLIEAMTLSKPSVVTAVGAMPEMVAPQNEPACGIVVPSENVEALQSALESLLDDEELQVELGAAAQRRALANYSMGAVTGRLYELWGHVAFKARPTS